MLDINLVSLPGKERIEIDQLLEQKNTTNGAVALMIGQIGCKSTKRTSNRIENARKEDIN